MKKVLMPYLQIYKTFQPWFYLHFLLNLRRKKSHKVFWCVCPCFFFFFMILWSYKVIDDQTVSQRRDVIHANEHTKYANCGLPVKSWNFLLMSFCFMMKKDHFEQKMFLWPPVPLNKMLVWFYSLWIVNYYSIIYSIMWIF